MTTVKQTQPARQTWSDHGRLIGALAAKDIVDALKTKATLTTIIISLLMVLFYRALPLLTADDTLNVLVYAESESPLVTALERSPGIALYTYESRERLLHVFRDAESVELALEIPATAVDPQTDAPITIDGHVMYWVNDAQRAEIKALVEEELSLQLGRPVTLNLTGNDVYFDANTFFFAFSSTIALLFITVIIGISLVPNLMVEEKQAKTMDVLLVSPASAAHVVAGKAIAGLFYGVLGSAVVLAVFRHLILRWDLAILAAVLATLLMTAVGLLLGSVLTVRAQLQLVAWFVAIPLMIPVILVALEGLVPSGAVAVMKWIPSVLIAKIFRLSLTPNATPANYGIETAVTAAWIIALLALVVWVVRRQNR